MKKIWAKVPVWVKDTLTWTFYMGVLVSLYNWLGPTILKNGMYFPWSMLPYSILLALVALGVYNYASYHLKKADQVEKKRLANQKAKRAAIKQAGELQAQVAAKNRRVRNTQRQSRRNE